MNSILAFFSTHSKETVSVIVPLAIFGLNFFIQNRPRISQSVRHAFTFLIQEPLIDGDEIGRASCRERVCVPV